MNGREINKLVEEIGRLQAENEQLQRQYELEHKQQMPLIDLWHQAQQKPFIPNTKQLSLWVVAEIKRLKGQVKELEGRG